MKKFQVKQLHNIVKTLYEATDEIKKSIKNQNTSMVLQLLEDCQASGIQMGEFIEDIEGENCITVRYLEDYCDELAYVYNNVNYIDENEAYELLNRSVIKIENSLNNDIKIKKEIVFLPYKSSMWDSLESIWKAADKDKNCNAVVIPIPYFERNKDFTFGIQHYEGNNFPDYVPVTDWHTYDLAKEKPDAIYIHNPYDDHNLITSVHPYYYSKNLKKITDTLVYVPYYSTSGGMSEGQYSCSVYYNADYIVIQSPKYRRFFDKNLPDEKFLPFGSPKFDKIINMCKNPPEPPSEWKNRINGKKVYFFNTSIGGCMINADAYLKKMEYVFECFKGREDSVILWRPHPLLETAFKSMKKHYIKKYIELKEKFIQENIGILDETPDMEKTIAICDAFIGDSSTSVTSIFGIVGKELFILNNWINSHPEDDCWKYESIYSAFVDEDNYYISAFGSNIFKINLDSLNFEYVCKLSKYAYDGYYNMIATINNYTYIAGYHSQNMLVFKGNEFVREINFKRSTEYSYAFIHMFKYLKYLVLIPFNYDAIVRIDTSTDKVEYFCKGKIDIFVRSILGIKMCGGYCLRDEFLFLCSPEDNYIMAFDIIEGKEQLIATDNINKDGCFAMLDDGIDMWLLPVTGNTITRWNPLTGKIKEYDKYPDNFSYLNLLYDSNIQTIPFSSAVFYDEFIIFIPKWANMFIRFDKKTEKMSEYKLPFKVESSFKNGYCINEEYFNSGRFYHIRDYKHIRSKDGYYIIASLSDGVLYKINFETNDYKIIQKDIDINILKENITGFGEISEWVKYGCMEDSFNSLKGFLDGNIVGNSFSKEKQIEAYNEIASNNDGTCGKKVHKFIMDKI